MKKKTLIYIGVGVVVIIMIVLISGKLSKTKKTTIEKKVESTK